MKEIFKWNDKKLDLINKMALLRNGNVPISIVVLKGNKKSVELVAKKEKEILGSYFNVLKKGVEVKKDMVNFVPCDEATDISWLTGTYETIDVNTIHCFDWDKFLKRLGLERATKEQFKDFSVDMELKLESTMDKVIADVLYAHYSKRDDNVITEKDIQMIRYFASPEKPITKQTNESKTVTKTVTEKKPEDSIKPKQAEIVQKDEKAVKAEPVKEAKEEPKENVKAEEPIVESKIETDTDSKKQEETADSDMIAPTIKQVEKPTFVIKEDLTDEEIKKNDEMLSDLRALYKSSIIFMEKTCNSQYRLIINKMQDAIDTNVFKNQFTKMYLEISDDTSTELYQKLYDVDVATKKFQKDVVHQIRHIGCFNCGNEWDEDITFLSKGPHTVRCPKCFSDYPFEK